MCLAGAVSLLALAGAARPAGKVFPGKNGRIAFTAGGALVTVNPDGSGRRTVVSEQRNASPSWSPDGEQIAFMRAAALEYALYEIWVADADGSGLARLTTNDVYDGDPAWSPDGDRIAFVSARDVHAGEQVWVMDADGGNPVSTDVRGSSPAWSPDGKRIAFKTTINEIALMDADGSDLKRLTDPSTLTGGSPAWSPDGKRLAFVGGPAGKQEMSVYVIDAAGGAPKRLTEPVHFLQTVAWSPDGTKLVYDLAASDAGGMEIFVVDAGGQGARKLAGGFGPDWQPLPEAGADLAVTLAGEPDPALPGSKVTFTALVENRGPGVSPGATLTLTPPRGTSVVSSSGGCAGSAPVVCKIGRLAKGRRATAGVTVKAAAKGTYTASATVAGAGPDPVAANNADDDDVAVSPCTIEGTARADRLTGTARADVICGLGGNDTIKGLGGNDRIRGGPGNDTIDGGAGNDTLTGDAGKDTLVGGGGKDKFYARDGTQDVIVGGGAADRARVDLGLDRLKGVERIF